MSNVPKKKKKSKYLLTTERAMDAWIEPTYHGGMND